MVSTVKIDPKALANLHKLAGMIAGESGYDVVAQFGQVSGSVSAETATPSPSVRQSSPE
jgi:hypothetical protein